jgi:magnesium transporter
MAGNVKTTSGQFKKSDLCMEHRLNVSTYFTTLQIPPQLRRQREPRDLRKIDSRVPNLIPTILVRKEAILVRKTP